MKHTSEIRTTPGNARLRYCVIPLDEYSERYNSALIGIEGKVSIPELYHRRSLPFFDLNKYNNMTDET